MGFNYIGNAGKARVDGFELEVFSLLTEQLQLGIGMGYHDARLTEDQPLLEVDTPIGKDGDPIPYVPKFTSNVSLQYDFPINGGAWNGYVRGDYSFTGSSDTQFNDNGAFFYEQDSYSLVDARLGVENEDWRVVFYVDNLFDKRAEVTVVENLAVPLSIFTNRPLTFGATISRNF